jgi:hypothetical protein
MSCFFERPYRRSGEIAHASAGISSVGTRISWLVYDGRLNLEDM